MASTARWACCRRASSSRSIGPIWWPGYLGQTAIKTAEVVASAAGGVLFIDEAYSLAGDQYGTEAVDTLVKEMEDRRDDLVLIVAGYPDPMAIFIAQNPGLSSRFRTTIEFDDYSEEELVEIFLGMANAADYDVTEECLRRFQMILRTAPRGPMFGNGRFARICSKRRSAGMPGACATSRSRPFGSCVSSSPAISTSKSPVPRITTHRGSP